jgi:hypothetical protein
MPKTPRAEPRRPAWSPLAFHGARWIWVVALAALIRLAFPSGNAHIAPLLEPGDVAERDVVAPFSFVVNKSDVELAREANELARAARPIYEFQPRAYDSATAAVRAFFSGIGAAVPRGATAIVAAAREHDIMLTAREAAYLRDSTRREALAAALDTLLARTLGQGVSAAGALQVEDAPELIVRRSGTELAVPREAVASYAEYLAAARALHPDRGSSAGDAAYLKLVGHFFRPTLALNRVESERRRDELRRSVDRSKYLVRGGDRIVAAHEVVTTDQHEQVVALHDELLRRGAATSRSMGGVVGPLLRDLLLVSIFWVLLLFYRRETYTNLRQVGVIAALFAIVILGAAAVARAQPAHPELIPLPLAAVMLTVLFNGRVSMIAALIVAFVIGSQPVFHDTPALFLCAVGGVTAALSVRSLRRRSHLYLAVLVVGLGYLVAAVVLGLTGDWSLPAIGTRAVLGVFNGTVSASLALLLLPQAESVTRITTDLTLLELSDQSHPLLRRLSLEAPGTYAHSIAMANLVEAACHRVGANGLLGRVGCYFHDVGKLTNPQYFVENQTRANPHDRLPAARSAEIIKSHVTEGLRLAQEARLPSVVCAFIPEHHGTAEISYFLDRARRQGETGARSAQYRYPGPRPRSIETAVAMLADSVEAALRVLDDVTPERIGEVIDHIVRSKLSAGQLDEAPLTLQQIEEIKLEFRRMLTGMYHGRIDYPEAGGGISAEWQGGRVARPSFGL